MTVNKGKVFEQDFKDSVDETPGIWAYRPSDFGGGHNSRFTNHSLCDFFVFNNIIGELFLFELKSTQSTSISCPSIKDIRKVSAMQSMLHDNLTAEEKKDVQKALKELLKRLNSYKIKYHQLKSLMDIECRDDYTRMHPYFLLNFRNVNETYLIKPTDLYRALIDTEKASVNIADIKKFCGVLIPQTQVRKTQHYTYHIENVLGVNNAV